ETASQHKHYRAKPSSNHGPRRPFGKRDEACQSHLARKRPRQGRGSFPDIILTGISELFFEGGDLEPNFMGFPRSPRCIPGGGGRAGCPAGALGVPAFGTGVMHGARRIRASRGHRPATRRVPWRAKDIGWHTLPRCAPVVGRATVPSNAPRSTPSERK